MSKNFMGAALALLALNVFIPAARGAQPLSTLVWNVTFQWQGDPAPITKQNNFNANGTGNDSDGRPYTYTVTGSSITWTFTVFDQCVYTGTISTTGMSGTMSDPVSKKTGTWSATPVSTGTYPLTVINGSGGGSFSAGTTVSITAFAPTPEHPFKKWTQAIVTNAYTPRTTLLMPAAATTVTANFAVPPTVTSVTPPVGTVDGGTPVTIAGSNFATSGTVIVNFGSVAASNVVVVTSTKLTCTTPAVAAGTVYVTVTNPGNLTSTSVVSFTFGTLGEAETASLSFSELKPDSSSFKGEIDQISFPTTITQESLTGTTVSLALANSTVPFTATLSKTGKGKNSTGLTAIEVSVSKQMVSFTISKIETLNSLIQALPGWTYTTPAKGEKKPAPFTLSIPAVLEVSGTTLQVVVNFSVKCQQSSTTVKGSVPKS